MLLDEPSTGLDTAGVDRLLQLIGEELSSGCIMALVSHEPRLFHGHTYRRVTLRRGRVIDDG